MKHTIRCMKNEVGFAYEACLRHTESFCVLRFIDVADVCFMATKLTLRIRQSECFILFAPLFTFWNIYCIITLGSYLLDKLEFGGGLKDVYFSKYIEYPSYFGK